ncbi:MAG: class I SAM-dependent methyltransferase [Anaerolineae bacterium]|nr:class I SAM-dependent methyltransferase [Anaerolineae bacterium]
MTDHFQHIYAHDAKRYERLIAREDQRGNLFAALMEIHPFSGIQVAEFGAGTGRLTRILSVLAKHIAAFDASLPMLREGQRVLEETGQTNWSLAVADNRAMPLPDAFAEMAIEGWSFAHVMGWYPDTWQQELDGMLGEMFRVLKPGGTAVLIETMGTGQREPKPPNEPLATMYAHLENQLGFSYRWIRTDYQFASVEEADKLIRFFFGDEMADTQVAGKNIIVPECTGIWWKTV